jgi:hypothetical protein
MLPPISPDDLATLIDEAAFAARRLHRKLMLPAADLDDLRQDLLVDLICRLPGFDARRGSIGAFANIVLRNQSSRIAIRHHRQRKIQGGTVLSLDAPASGATEPLGCCWQKPTVWPPGMGRTALPRTTPTQATISPGCWAACRTRPAGFARHLAPALSQRSSSAPAPPVPPSTVTSPACGSTSPCAGSGPSGTVRKRRE